MQALAPQYEPLYRHISIGTTIKVLVSYLSLSTIMLLLASLCDYWHHHYEYWHPNVAFATFVILVTPYEYWHPSDSIGILHVSIALLRGVRVV